MADRSIPIIGLAGGIGAGKSEAARILEDLGCVVSRSDQVGHAALNDTEIRRTLVEWWGPGILSESGEVDRKAVAKTVFSDAEQRRRLEALIHPWIRARQEALFAAAPPRTPALVIDAPLLFEASLADECDTVIFVDASRQARLERLRTSRGWSEAQLAQREESQLPLDVKRSRADYVVKNDSDLNELADQVRLILSEIAALHRK